MGKRGLVFWPGVLAGIVWGSAALGQVKPSDQPKEQLKQALLQGNDQYFETIPKPDLNVLNEGNCFSYIHEVCLANHDKLRQCFQALLGGLKNKQAVGEQIAMVVGKKPGTSTITARIDKVEQVCAVTVTASTLPPGWSYDELNTPPIPGSVLVAGGKFTLTGCGHAMTSWWERVRDQGGYVSKAVTGDVAISARLTSLAPNVGGPAYQWDNRPPTASGLMIRESLAQRCGRYLLVQVEASGDLNCLELGIVSLE